MLGLINFYIGFQVQHTGAIGSGQEVPAFLPYFLTEMVVGCFGGVMGNWLHLPDYPVKDRLAATAAFLGEAIAPPGGRGRSA